MPTHDPEIQAQSILDQIASTPFEQCKSLTREFQHIPARPGIYAVRHRTDGLLYKRSNPSRKVMLYKPKFKSNFLPLMPKLF
jgi:hypothetical protein